LISIHNADYIQRILNYPPKKFFVFLLILIYQIASTYQKEKTSTLKDNRLFIVFFVAVGNYNLPILNRYCNEKNGSCVRNKVSNWYNRLLQCSICKPSCLSLFSSIFYRRLCLRFATFFLDFLTVFNANSTEEDLT